MYLSVCGLDSLGIASVVRDFLIVKSLRGGKRLSANTGSASDNLKAVLPTNTVPFSTEAHVLQRWVHLAGQAESRSSGAWGLGFSL